MANCAETRCGTPPGATCHCGLCHQTFGTVTDFDGHQNRTWGAEVPVTCKPVSSFGLLRLIPDDAGTWRTPEGLREHERVREMARRMGRARAALRATAPVT